MAAAADYTLAWDAKRRLLLIGATGFWDKALLDRFGAELRVALRRQAAGGAFGVLADARDYPVQSISVSLGFMGIVRSLDRDLLMPTAVVTRSVLLRLQALRVFVAPHIRIFGEVDAAENWLAGSIEEAAA